MLDHRSLTMAFFTYERNLSAGFEHFGSYCPLTVGYLRLVF